MRVYISADMEGIAGVITWEQVEETGGEEYNRFRRLMTDEVNAAVKGALDAGAETIVVNDGHGKMKNILIESLNPKAQLINGAPKKLGMLEGINRGFNAACFIGYHARAGSSGVLAHTINDIVRRLQVNGKDMGELGLNALLAGYFGVPVVFVSGDQVLGNEAKKLLGDVEIVIAKEALGYHMARSLSPKQVRKKIMQGFTRSLRRKNLKPLVPPTKTTITIEFNSPIQAAAANIFPGSQRIDAFTVTFTCNDYLKAYQGVRSMIYIADNWR